MVCGSLRQAVALSDTMMVNRYVKWQLVNKEFRAPEESEQERKLRRYFHTVKCRPVPPALGTPAPEHLYVAVLLILPGFPGLLVNAGRPRYLSKPIAVSSHALWFIKHTQAVLVPIHSALPTDRHSVYR
jgi:hypothetical protein